MSFAGHRAFLVIADHLTRAGFAVLRVDDRGVGQSEGDWRQASYEMLAADAASAIGVLQQTDGVAPDRVGVFGVSEGSMIAAMTAAAGKAAFAVLGSPPGLSGEALLRSQLTRTLEAQGAGADQVRLYTQAFDQFVQLARAAAADDAAMPALEDFMAGPGRALMPAYGFVPRESAERARLIAGPWYQSQLNLDPAPYFAHIRAPCLVIGGDRDTVLPPAENHPRLQAQLAAAEFALVPGVNHILQPALTGSPAEYAQTETTVDPRVLDAVTDWLRRNA